MTRRIKCRLLITLSLIAAFAANPVRGEDDPGSTQKARREAFFSEHVLPILRQHCFKCHSHAAKKSKGGLVLDSRSGWFKGGDSGPAVAPGKPDKSLLIQAVRYADNEMPPNGKLPAKTIALLEKWVADGAHDPRVNPALRRERVIDLEEGRKHWSFRPLAQAGAPKVKNRQWPLSDTDRFVLHQLEQRGLRPVADADRYTWLRRVTLDLTGLTPTVEQIDAFIQDRSANAYAHVVDRLLASRAFGERWARHWLDLVGYADQIGTSNNVFAEHAWRYRDYVINSFNNDKPFDEFVREQIAGDLLPYHSPEQRADGLTALGFLVLGDIEIVEADKAKMDVDIIDRQVSKVSKAFLGMTVECARCHDHKFDPIRQRDYYALAGFFHSTSSTYKTNRGVWSDVNIIELPETSAQLAARKARQAAHAARVGKMKSERQAATARRAQLDKQLKNKSLAKADRDRMTKERNDKNARIGRLNRLIEHAEYFAPTVPRAYGVHEAKQPSHMRITIRGNPRALGEEVPRGFLAVAAQAPAKIPSGQSGRLQLAQWISGAGNPLTARVAVNRIWQKLFGHGLVRSVDYFGVLGQKPTHPDLLDYLAREFIHRGWSQKRLIRQLVLSRTYRLGTAHNSTAHAMDPENRLLWRMNRLRLDAEALRDSMIFASGRLIESSGGSAMPLEFLENVGNISPKSVNPASFQLARWRPEQEFQRTIYLPVLRSTAQPGPAALRNVFDFPQPNLSAGRRDTTAVPTQALFLMNSPTIKKHATALAARLKASHDSKSVRLRHLWLTLLGRPPTASEQQAAFKFLQAESKSPWMELCRALLGSNEFLMRL